MTLSDFQASGFYPDASSLGELPKKYKFSLEK